jgi:phosphoglucosamine mutase
MAIKDSNMKRNFFGTDGIRGKVGEGVITAEFAMKLGWAVGRVFAADKRGKVMIGKDTRISGYMLESALESGLAAAGCDIRLLGPMPTPAIAYLTKAFRADLGVVISASHNSFEDNGIKFFNAQGEKLSDDIEQKIELELNKPMTTVPSANIGRAAHIADAGGRYVEFCKGSCDYLDLSGLTIVLDCANGAGYEVAPKVFKELGAKIHLIGSAPNGMNINDKCGATHPKHLQKAVLEQEADLGIAFDGDADRVIMVDNLGRIVDGDELIYLIARHAQRMGTLDGGVVGTIMTNLGIEKAFEKKNIPFVRANVGDRYVMEELLKHEWQLGGEGSGHIICRNVTTTGDAVIAGLQVLHALVENKQTLAEACASLHKYPMEMINIKVKSKSAILESKEVAEQVANAETQLADRGRVVLRPSGTEPLIRVMVEGRDSGEVRQICQNLASFVESLCV